MKNISKKAKEALKKLCDGGMNPGEARELIELRYGEKISRSSAYSLVPVGATTGNRLSEKQKVKVKECIGQGMKSPEINRILKAIWGIMVVKSTISYIRSEMKKGKEKKEEKMEEGLHIYRGRIPHKVRDAIIKIKKDILSVGGDAMKTLPEIIKGVNNKHGITLSEDQVKGIIENWEQERNPIGEKKKVKIASTRKSRKEIKATGNETLTVEELIDECRSHLDKIENSYKAQLAAVRDHLKSLVENLVCKGSD